MCCSLNWHSKGLCWLLSGVPHLHTKYTKCSIWNQSWLLRMNHFTHKTKQPVTDNIEFLQPYPVVAVDALLEISTALNSAVLSFDGHLSQTNTSCVPKFCYQSVYCLIRYILVRISIAKCFTNSSKRFRCEVMFENEHTFCSWIHHVHSFWANGVSSGLVTSVTLTRVSQVRLGKNITRRWTCLWFHFCTAVIDCFWAAF
jgi:hypothetical protein